MEEENERVELCGQLKTIKDRLANTFRGVPKIFKTDRSPAGAKSWHHWTGLKWDFML
ncbi:conserved hypothetical protein [Ricinus communis]|uniref:Uncharacterized protein n=1 Tax=Ricinus communis TaxID=3988 RepID=B9T483_RICCO|nr:conserved hypothetical protein [Ricinus communis]